MGNKRTRADEQRLVQAAFDHFQCSYVHRNKIFTFSEQVGEAHYGISRICVKYLGREQAKLIRGYFRLPTVVDGCPFVDHPDKYLQRDRELEASKGASFVASREPNPESLERVLQGLVTEVVERIEPGLTVKKSFLRVRTPRGQRREIDLLCEDRERRPVVSEFKRGGEKPRDVVGQVVEYMGMVKLKTGAEVRGFIVVDQAWPAIENSAVVVPGLRVLRYAVVLPEIFHP